MQRTPVVSKTGMTGYAYQPETETLEISFASRKEGEPDRVYHYAAFKATDWAHFLAAESKGSWFIRVIKPKFACTKVEPEKTVIRVWQIGPDGTEYYAAHSEQEMRDWYVQTVGEKEAEEDLREHFEEVTNIDEEMDFNDDGETKKTTWRKLAEDCVELPCQLSTGYN